MYGLESMKDVNSTSRSGTLSKDFPTPSYQRRVTFASRAFLIFLSITVLSSAL